MDIVQNNVVPFDYGEENTAPALTRQVAELYEDFRQYLKRETSTPLPPCVVSSDCLNFAPAAAQTGKATPSTEIQDFSPFTVNADKVVSIACSSEANLEATAARQSAQSEFKGSLYLIGGHADNTFNEMVKIAGRDPKVAVVGRASGLDDADEALAEDFFKAGVKLDDITIIVPKGYEPKDRRFNYSYDLPKDANLVYFGGGKQDKLRAEFDEHQLAQVKDLLMNGAVVGGSSAGAAVMSQEMINGGDEKQLEQAHGFGLTPWAILDTHVGQRHREARDVKALYDIGQGQLPVLGLDEDTRVRYFWDSGKLWGEIGGLGTARIFQTPAMPNLNTNREVTAKTVTDGGQREARVWELHAGDLFEVHLPASPEKQAVQTTLRRLAESA